MIIDASAIDSGSLLQADVCIVGGGAAGITLAMDLLGRGLDLLLLESGGPAASPSVQDLYRGEVVNARLHSPPDKYRQRQFGGSTAIWGGRCAPFDPIDFEARPFVPGSGWPIGYDEVACHYPAANRLMEAGACEYDADEGFNAEDSAMFAGFHSERVRTNGLERFSCPTDFAVRYRRRLELAPDLRVILRANCTAIRLAADGRLVKRLEVGTLEGRRFSVAARRVVLAIGGLETPRLLLASNDVQTQGIGNLHDVVGRYYMCHIAGNTGELHVDGPTSAVVHGYLVSKDGVYCRRRLSLTAAEQRRIGAANMVARLHFPRVTDPSHRSGVLSGLCLVKRLVRYEYGKRLDDGEPPSLGHYLRHLRNVLADPFYTIAFLSHWVTRRTLAPRKFPSVILRNRSNRFSLEVNAEQRPMRESRVTLGNERDALGMPRIKVDWRYCRADIDSVARTLAVFAEEFSRSGLISLRYDSGKLEEDLTRFGAYGGHHIGTTRMGDDSRCSVVDRNCRVNGVCNLYIAGSAVFPTSSQANPTLHIAAMALRLSKHLAEGLGSRSSAAAVVEQVAS